jgi:hypothetical protein
VESQCWPAVDGSAAREIKEKGENEEEKGGGGSLREDKAWWGPTIVTHAKGCTSLIQDRGNETRELPTLMSCFLSFSY